ncbi:atherin-like [Copidosoma floridanum]|uniref:atherin-like n=1 Tax=Copidosoma floridanum TaxID=29053 RepID=UPI0006C98D7A|nr:atherin-like [Copidosoma floridanum]
MTSRRAGGPEAPSPPQQPRHRELAQRAVGLTGSLQNLSQEGPLVPPPVPPRTPQVRQPRGRARPQPPRPLPPLPARPTTATRVPEPAPRANLPPVIALAPQPPLGASSGSSSSSISDGEGNGEASSMFAKCGPRAASRDEPEEPPPSTLVEGREVPGPGTSGTRLRPPLVGTAGLSADSGTGDSGSAEMQPEQRHPGAGEDEDEEEEEGEVDEEGADDELADDLDELRGLKGQRQQQGGSGVQGTGGGFGVSRQPLAKGAKQQVKPFTKDSLDRLENKHVQLVRDYGFQPKRKTSVEDGGVLPNKFEPFPSNLYGRPLEEIDSFIYDEVGNCLMT